MRSTLWTTALLLGVGFSLALPAVSARYSPADAAAAPAAEHGPDAALAATGQAAPAGGEAPLAAHEQAAQQAPDAGTAAPADKPPPQLNAAAQPADLDDAIDRWRQTLARESGFEAWHSANWTSYPLGPGLHGYVVLLRADGKEVGYMIVTAAADGTFKLTEYGIGERPLFSLATLYRSAVQQELIPSSVTLDEFLSDSTSLKERLYNGPLHALWKLTVAGKTTYVDAKTGETLPLSEELLQLEQATKAADSASSETESVSAKLHRPAFDPYERISWATGKPLPLAEFDEVSAALTGKQRLVYVAELYGGKMTVPLAVTGYHIWNGPAEPYLALDQDGDRFIRYAALQGAGRFYP